MAIRFVVTGKPHGKGSVRARARGSFAQTYQDPVTRAYEAKVREAARHAMGAFSPFEGPVKMLLRIRLLPPTSASRKLREKMLSGRVRPTKKPDNSNVLKSCEDGCSGVVFLDDAQVVSGSQEKIYAETEGVDVIVIPLDLDQPDNQGE